MGKGYTTAHFDFDDLPWLTSPRKKLELKGVAMGLIHLPPDEGYTFTHFHRYQEEVYTVIEGSGQFWLNGELQEIQRGDIVRVDPATSRAIKAGGDGLFIVCAGAVPMGYPHNPNSRYLIDDGVPEYDNIPPWHRGKPEIVQRNQHLKERMERARNTRQK